LENCPLCPKIDGTQYEFNKLYRRSPVTGHWVDNALVLNFSTSSADGTQQPSQMNLGNTNSTVVTSKASIEQISSNASLHTIDEVAKYYESLPTPPKGFGQIFVDHSGRVFVRTMIAMPGVNKHNYGLNEEHIPKNIDTIKGVPLTFVLQKVNKGAGPDVNFPHPAIQGADWRYNQGFQKAYTIGKYIARESKPDANKVWHGISEVTHPKAKQFFTDLYTTKKQELIPLFVSPQILHYSDENPLDIKKWWFQHVTITNDPAYPKEYAQITASCVGDESKCIPELKQSSLSEVDKSAEIESLRNIADRYKEQEKATQIVDADTCPVCVMDALKEIITTNEDNSSLITKSATSSQYNMNENQGTTGGENPTTGLTASTTTFEQSKEVAKPENSENRTGAIPSQVKKDEIENPKQPQGYSAELESKNLPAQIEAIIKDSIGKYLGSITTNRNANEQTTVGKPKEESKRDEVAEMKAELQRKEKEKSDAIQSEAQKALLDRVAELERTNKKLNDAERRRKIEMTLLTFREGKQFLDPKTKEFDEARFKKQVDHWMKTGLEAEKVEEQLTTMLELVGPLAADVATETPSKNEKAVPNNKNEPNPQRAYASNSEIESNETPIFKQKENPADIESQNASMQNILVDEPYFLRLEKKTVLRSNQLGEVL
jgi:hypothetical protein